MHIPVLEKEVIYYLDPKPNENFIDCTIGEGGHAAQILEKTAPEGKLLGIDWDEEQIKNCRLNLWHLKNRLILVCDSYSNLKRIVQETKFENISGILLDLGMSSWHIEISGRGFSFRKNEPLDMRYSEKTKLTAQEILNSWAKENLEKILQMYGEEKFAKKIVREIVEERKNRKIENTFQLVEIIRRATPKWYHRQKIHFATKTFQALRIAVNNELKNLKKVLPQALDVLESEGRIVIISFHSLEDRIVKKFLKVKEREGKLKILTKKPISPSFEEIKNNPRSKSAKLRAAKKL